MIDIPPQLPPQASLSSAAQGESLLPGSIPQPHSSGGNTVIPLPQPAGVSLPSAIGTVSQLNVTNATSEAVSIPALAETAGSDASTGNSSNGTIQAGAVNGQSQNVVASPASEYALPRTAADVFSSVPENEEGAESATMNADAAARLTAIFRPESSEEWKKALQKAGQQQQTITNSGDGESAGQTLSMKEAQAQYGQDKESTISPTNGTATRGRSDTVQSPASASSNTVTGNDSDNDHKVWKPRRTLRA